MGTGRLLAEETLSHHTPHQTHTYTHTTHHTHHTHTHATHFTHTLHTLTPHHTQSHTIHAHTLRPPFPRDAVLGARPRLLCAHMGEVVHEVELWGLESEAGPVPSLLGKAPSPFRPYDCGRMLSASASG